MLAHQFDIYNIKVSARIRPYQHQYCKGRDDHVFLENKLKTYNALFKKVIIMYLFAQHCLPRGGSTSNISLMKLSNSLQMFNSFSTFSWPRLLPMSSSSISSCRLKFPPMLHVYANTYSLPKRVRSWAGFFCK